MFTNFDRALERALSTERTYYGVNDQRLVLATARRAAGENRVRALNEASLGKVRFAAIHESASACFHEDAEAMLHGRPPIHHSMGRYLEMAETYRKADLRKARPADLTQRRQQESRAA